MKISTETGTRIVFPIFVNGIQATTAVLGNVITVKLNNWAVAKGQK